MVAVQTRSPRAYPTDLAARQLTLRFPTNQHAKTVPAGACVRMSPSIAGLPHPSLTYGFLSTPGRALLQRSVIVFNELRQGINEIEHLADPAVGEVRNGTTPPMSAIASAVHQID